MDKLLENITQLVEAGKIDKTSPYPPELAGKDGVSELCIKALEKGIKAQTILNKGLMPGMNNIGEKFARGEAFIPNLLIAAKAMNAAMEHLKPYFRLGEISPRGSLVLGTVRGDLHDIGKNLVKMIMKGDGWNVIDLGTDVDKDKFVNAVNNNKGAIVGMSALLTTTMMNMEQVAIALRKNNPATRIYIGGAPVSQSFCDDIGADGYFRDPHSFALSLRENE